MAQTDCHSHWCNGRRFTKEGKVQAVLPTADGHLEGGAQREEHRFTNARSAQPQSWYHFSAGHAQRIQWAVAFGQGGKVRVGIYIDSLDGDWIKRLFDSLHEQSASVESEFGEPLEWERLDDRRASRVSTVRSGSIDDGDDPLDETRKWMVERLLKFREVFGPRLEELAG